MLNTFGFVCVAFVVGALALFAPKFVHLAYQFQGNNTSQATVSLYFGIVTCGAGFLGILSGGSLAYVVKKKFAGGDALVCAFGLTTSSIFLFFTIYSIEYIIAPAWVMMFIGMTLVCMNWSLTADILLYTVVPTRRSTAEALQIFLGHALGDAGSPYLLGSLSQYLNNDRGMTKFKGLQYSLYTSVIVAMIGGGLYVICSFYIPRDRARADAVSHGAVEDDMESSVQVASDDAYDEHAPLI